MAKIALNWPEKVIKRPKLTQIGPQRQNWMTNKQLLHILHTTKSRLEQPCEVFMSLWSTGDRYNQ